MPTGMIFFAILFGYHERRASIKISTDHATIITMNLISHPLGQTGLNVSPVGLGTVEIGLAYGLEQRLPSDAEAERILKYAVESGVTYFDTARGYGVAEERIGKSGILKRTGIVVGTKCAQFLEQGEDPRGVELEQKIRADIETSLTMLQVDCLQLVQLHGSSAEQIERGELITILQQLIDEGLVQHVGIAVRGEAAAQAAIDSGFFKTIQLAHSILDQRMCTQILPAAASHTVGIINRSVLLRGALTPGGQNLPEQLAPLKANAAEAATIAADLSIDLPTLAMRFVLSNPAVTTALLGTYNPSHLDSALAAAAAGPLPIEVLSKLQILGLTDPMQVDPSQWPKM